MVKMAGKENRKSTRALRNIFFEFTRKDSKQALNKMAFLASGKWLYFCSFIEVNYCDTMRKILPKQLFFLLLVAVVFSCNSSQKTIPPVVAIDPYHYTITKKTIAENGAVVSAHPLASKVGVEILKKGGNAVDAAIATQLALAVVYPNAGNLGGGGFMVARLSNTELLALDYREMAPGNAHRDMYVDPDGTARTDKSQDGHLSSGVPGTVAGLFAAHKHGKLPFEQLIQRRSGWRKKDLLSAKGRQGH
jgi:gamma-glutamyltranspeptidase/glutathione hydrolase